MSGGNDSFEVEPRSRASCREASRREGMFRMMEERQDSLVSERLSELRRAMSKEVAPERVKPAVLLAFREAKYKRQRTVWLTWGAIAASALVAIASVWYARAGHVDRSPAIASNRVAPPPSATRNSVSNEESRAVRPVTAKRDAPARTRRRAVARVKRPANRGEIATEFFALPFAPPLDPTDGGHVVRVSLPRGAMRSVGLPVDEDRWYERVPADVVLGQDGLARAVRFVKISQ